MYVSSARILLRDSSDDASFVDAINMSDRSIPMNVNNSNSLGNDTSVWSLDNPEAERSSTPLYPSVAQRIVEWTTLSSEQSRLKSLSYNDTVGGSQLSSGREDYEENFLAGPPSVPPTSPPPIFQQQQRRYSDKTSRLGSTSSLERSGSLFSSQDNRVAPQQSSSSVFSVFKNNNNSDGTTTLIVDDDMAETYYNNNNNNSKLARSSQTEVMPNLYANYRDNQQQYPQPVRRNTESEFSFGVNNNNVNNAHNNGQLKIHFEMLIAELDASRDLNRKLSMQLAKTERDLQSLKIQQDLHNDRMDSIVASRVSEILNRLCENDVNLKHTSDISSLAPSPPTIDNFDFVPDPEVKRLLMQLNKPNLNADEIAKNCSAMINYVKSRGGDCRIGSQNEIIFSEKMHNLNVEKTELENRLQFMTERMKHVEFENLALKTRLDESSSIGAKQSAELRDIIKELKYENEKLKANLTEATKKATKPLDIMNLETEINEMKRQLDRELIEKQELFLQLNTVSSRLNEPDDRQDLLNQIDRYRSEIDRFRLDIDRLSAELRETRDQSLEASRRRDQNERRIADELSNSLAQCHKLHETVNILESTKSNTDRSKLDYDRLLTDYEKSIENRKSLETDLVRLKGQLAESENFLSENDTLLEKLRTELSQKIAACEILRQEVDSKSKFVEEHQSDLSEKMDLVQQLRSDLNVQTKLSDELRSDLLEKNQSIDKLRSDFAAASQREKSELQLDVNEKIATTQKLQLQLSSESDQSNKLRSELKEKIDLIDKLRSELNASVDHENRSADELTKVCDENESLRHQCDDLSESCERMTGELAHMVDEHERLLSLVINLRAANKEKAKSFDNVDKNRSSDNEKAGPTDNAKNLQSQDDLRLQLNKSVEEQERLSKDYEKLREKYERQETKWEREFYDLRRRFQEADEEKFQLQEELKLQKRDFEREIDLLKLDAERRIIEESAAKNHKSSAIIDNDIGGNGELEQKLTTISAEKKQLETKNDELKRLVTVLRRKLGALTT